MSLALYSLPKFLLKELEKQCRSRFQTISGYQINRSTSESTTLTDLLRELEALECEVASLLDGFQQADIADIAVPIAQLLLQRQQRQRTAPSSQS